MSLLAETQRALQAHIVHEDARIAELIHGTAAASKELRLKIYSDAYRLRLIEALAANFPVMAKALDEEAFARLTQVYLSFKPSQHFSIRWFGHELASFLRAHAEYATEAWLSELAEWEWSIAHAFDASESSLLTLNALASVAADDWPQLAFEVHPSTRRVSLTTNVVDIVKSASNDEALPVACACTPSEWLIWRQELTVRYRALELDECAALDALMNGATFAELCETLSLHMENDAVPLRAMSLLKQWLAEGLLTEAASEG